MGLLEKIKPALAALPKSKAKYRTTTNAYKSTYFLNCYFNDVSSLEPVALELEGENLWKGIISHGDEQLSPNDLINIGKSLDNS